MIPAHRQEDLAKATYATRHHAPSLDDAAERVREIKRWRAADVKLTQLVSYRLAQEMRGSYSPSGE